LTHELAQPTPPTTRSRAEADREVHEIRLAGCRSHPLIGYLKALGLLRVIARQIAPEARARWAGEVLSLRSRLDEGALEDFLLTRYAPAPVVSPWNGGSGFFPGDNKRAFTAIESSFDQRIAPLRRAIDTSRSVLAELGIEHKPPSERKVELVRHLRARLDDDALEWLDAAIVLLGSDRAFPPLLGSGGNDGRYDFANNYAQAVVSTLALDADEQARELTERQLKGALYAHPVELRAMSAAHLLRDQSPVNSPSGESDGLGNPWDLVLAVEGCCLFSPGAARRNRPNARGSLVAPFTSRPTAAGYGSALAGEQGRAEMWLPLWDRWTSLTELSALVHEGRAQVRRREARTGLDFLRASAELAVARGIDAFARYALLERAGQSTLAVPAGTHAVREHPHVRAIDTLDGWLSALQDYARGDCPRSHRQAIARLDRRLFAFATEGSQERACAVLEAAGAVESLLAASRIAAGRGLIPLERADIQPWLEAADDGSHEFAVAASLATLHDPARSADADLELPSLPRLRDYIHGTSADERGRGAYAPGIRPAIAARANPIARLAQIHVRRHLDAGSRRAPDRRQGERVSDGRVVQLAFPHGIACPLASARAFAAGGMLDEQRIARLMAGLSIFRPRWPKLGDGRLWSAKAANAYSAPLPAFDLLALAFAGTYKAQPANADRIDEPRVRPSGRERGVPLQPAPGWVAQLTADHREPVLRDALLRLHLAGLSPLVRAGYLLSTRSPDGLHLAAALLLHVEGRDRIATSLTTAVVGKQTHDFTTDAQETTA
jgi:CRISPR-associated protein Csx17